MFFRGSIAGLSELQGGHYLTCFKSEISELYSQCFESHWRKKCQQIANKGPIFKGLNNYLAVIKPIVKGIIIAVQGLFLRFARNTFL